MLQCNYIKKVIDSCVDLNQWNIVIELVKIYNVREIDLLLVKYVFYLLEKNKIVSVIEFYRKVGYFLNVVKFFFKVNIVYIYLINLIWQDVINM